MSLRARFLGVLLLAGLLAACGTSASGGDETSADSSSETDAPDVVSAATLEVDAPLDGAVVLPGAVVSFELHTTCLGCTVRASSSLGGTLFELRPSSSGQVLRDVTGLQAGAHVLSLELLHPDGRVLRAVTQGLRVDLVPTAPAVHLEPAAPTTDVTLTVVFDTYATDPDGDPVSYTYRWARDGVLALENTSKTLSASLTARGETWSVAAVPRDPWGEGPAATAEVVVVDSAPAVTTVVVLPSVGTAATQFSCAWYGWSDPDLGDPEQPRYVFLKNGVELGPAGSSPLFPGGHVRGDQLACRVHPFDGELEGAPVQSQPVVIADAEPTVGSVTLSPLAGDVTATYTCTADGAADPDGDEVSLGVRWRADGTLLPGETSTSVAGSLFQRGQRLRCEVVPSDGLLDGLPVASNEVVLADAPPVLPAAMLSPAEATEGTVLACTPGAATDPDDDEVVFRFDWRVDGVPVDGEHGPTLGGARFDKGQGVECAVTPESNGLTGALVVAKPTVTVVNTPPTLAGASLSPQEGGRQTEFTCVRGVFVDPDPLDDPQVWATIFDPQDSAEPGFTIDWFLNGQKQAGEHALTFRPKNGAPGQQVRCRIGASDGQAEAVPVDAAAVTLVNHAPGVADVTLAPPEPREGDVLLCSANQGVDPDGDAVALQIEWLVNGEGLADEAQAQLDGRSFDEGDAVLCRVTPVDMYGLAGSAVSSAAVTVWNSAPSVGPVTLTPDPAGPGATLTCAAAGLADPDPTDTALALYAWARNGVLLQGQGASTYAVGAAADGETVSCSVTPFDGTIEGSEVASNTVTLRNQPPALEAVHLEPATLTTDTPAVCVAEGAVDPEGASVTIAWAWYVNSALQADVTADTLDDDRFVRGDTVFCLATPSDGTQAGSTRSSGPVIVANSPPGAFGVTIVPDEPGSSDAELQCVRTSEPFDADGDGLTYATAWTLDDGTELGAGAALPTSGLTRCDLLRCTTTADDGFGGLSSAVSEPAVFDGSFGAHFDGVSSRVTVAATGALYSTGALTVEAWVRPAQAGVPASVAARGLAGGSRYDVGLTATGAARFGLTTGGPGAGAIELVSASALAPGEWGHVAAQWDGASARLYVQGALQAGAPLGGFLAPDGDLVVGAAPFAGDLDDLRLSSVARYDLSFAPPSLPASDANTLLLFAFERVEQQGVVDSGPNGLTGQPTALTDAAGACFPSGQPDRPPTAPGVALTPAAPTVDDDLECEVAVPSADPEGGLVTYTPLWYLDGLLLADLTGQWTLPAARTDFCDRVTCRVVPSDGALAGPWGEAAVQVEAPVVNEVLKYHHWPDPPPAQVDQKWIPWDGAFVYGQTFAFAEPVTVLGVRYFQRGTYNTGSGRMRKRFDHGPPYDFDERKFGTLVPGSSTESAFTTSVVPGWNTYVYPTPLVLDEPVVVMWTFVTSGGSAAERRVYFDDDPAANPDTVNWIFSSSYIETAAEHNSTVIGNFLIELIIEGDQSGVCP